MGRFPGVGPSTVPSTALVVNAQARFGERLLKEAQDRLRQAGVRLDQVLPVQEPEALRQLVRELVGGGIRRVVVGGGDGTVSAVASVLAGTPVELGVMPLGTGNDFARNLGIPTDLSLASEIVARGATAEVDVGRAGDTPFLNAASLGLSAELTKKMKPWVKRAFGKLSYPLLALGQLPEQKPFRVTLTAAQLRLTVDSYQVVVGNGRYHGAGKTVAPAASLHDSQLDLYLIVPTSTGDDAPAGLEKVLLLARVARKVKRGDHLQDPAVLHLAAPELTLETEPAQEVNLDGELLGATPMTFSVWPRALRVRVPREGTLARKRRVGRPLTRRRAS